MITFDRAMRERDLLLAAVKEALEHYSNASSRWHLEAVLEKIEDAGQDEIDDARREADLVSKGLI
jgi:hypothetical protein